LGNPTLQTLQDTGAHSHTLSDFQKRMPLKVRPAVLEAQSKRIDLRLIDRGGHAVEGQYPEHPWCGEDSPPLLE
jgi:hypothetical protein